MKDNQHIDRLYQEKFKDFEVTPNPEVWKNIEASLQKKKRRILPFWWVSSGAVATLLIGLLMFSVFSKKQQPKTKENIIITESPNAEDSEKKNVLPIESESIEIVENTNGIVKKTKQTTNKMASLKKKDDKIKKLIANKTPKYFSQKTEKNIIANKDTKETVADVEKAMKKNTLDKEVAKRTLKPKKDLNASLSEEHNIKKHPVKKNKWSVSPMFAVLNANSFSKGSPIDGNLKDNSVTGKNTYSYGINVAYQVDEKWSIQSGIHLQEIQFNTKNVPVVFDTFSNDTFKNITPSEAKPLPIRTDKSLVRESRDVRNMTINQSLSYVEVPIEVKYSLMNTTKFDTNIVVGFSSLLLKKNEIKATTDNFSKVLGKANNLNAVNFSGNLGLDFNYAFDKNFKINITPMFKTQLNTFSRDSNGFKPYTIGVYTGIKYEF